MPLANRGKAQSAIAMMNALDIAEQDLRKSLDILGTLEHLREREKNGQPVAPVEWAESIGQVNAFLKRFKPKNEN